MKQVPARPPFGRDVGSGSLPNWMVLGLFICLGTATSSFAGETSRVSVDSVGNQGNALSRVPAISADGRFVAFHSLASNLVAGDTPGSMDVFVHDRQTGETTRVSVDSVGNQGNGNSRFPAISADGRVVAFHSSASNLVAGDSNDFADVFVHDRQTGETTRVSVDSLGNQSNAGGQGPAISADGRLVAFESSGSNLVAGDTNGDVDVFVHDRQTGETTRVSVDSVGNQGNSLGSLSPAISADGRFVAFQSWASNLVAGDTNGQPDVFVHDRQTGETTLVSVHSLGNQSNARSFSPAISADGRVVAFLSVASNLVADDTNRVPDVFVHDRQTGETTRVSVDSLGNQGNGSSNALGSPSTISADGRVVAFESLASNLVAGDTNSDWDVFVHDQQTGETTRVSVDSLGNQGDAASLSSAISADGRFVAFHSWASGLVAGDTNGARDVFVHDRQTFSDADGDGIPDDSDPDVLSDFLETLPDEAFKRSSPRFRTAMQWVLDDVERTILAGDLRTAIHKLLRLRRHVNGCWRARADFNDWVTDCPSQIEVREMIDRLIANLARMPI